MAWHTPFLNGALPLHGFCEMREAHGYDSSMCIAVPGSPMTARLSHLGSTFRFLEYKLYEPNR